MNSFSYERFSAQTRFETEAQENSEMAYLMCEIQDSVDKNKNETTH